MRYAIHWFGLELQLSVAEWGSGVGRVGCVGVVGVGVGAGRVWGVGCAVWGVGCGLWGLWVSVRVAPRFESGAHGKVICRAATD